MPPGPFRLDVRRDEFAPAPPRPLSQLATRQPGKSKGISGLEYRTRAYSGHNAHLWAQLRQEADGCKAVASHWSYEKRYF